MLADLKLGDWEFSSTEELLAALKKKFREEDNEFAKVVELK